MKSYKRIPASTIRKNILSALEQMTPKQQESIYEYTLKILVSGADGIGGEELLKFKGLLEDEAAREIRIAIETECERIDTGAW
ncbi:MAG: hypothetical protein AB2L13_01605 [Spirochaetota bacterium]|jgi:hypothetical protein